MLIDLIQMNLLNQRLSNAQLRDAETRAADAAGLAKKQGKEKKPDANLVSLVFPGR